MIYLMDYCQVIVSTLPQISAQSFDRRRRQGFIGFLLFSSYRKPVFSSWSPFYSIFFSKGHLGLFKPADFTNGLLKFYSLNKSVNLEKWGPHPSTGQRNVSLLRRLTPDVIKWFQYKLTAIRAVRFNESLHSCSFFL